MLALLCVLAFDAPPSVQVQPATGGRVEVRATLAGKLLADVPPGRLTQDQGERWLRFCLLDKTAEGPAILGSYRRDGVLLSFAPRHALTPGQHYRAILDLGGGKRLSADYQAPAAAAETPAVVERIYPSGDVVPANHLKFYIHFSKPMRETGDVFDQIELLDQDGKVVANPWRRTELWDPTGKRLTMWIHPGQVKRGIGPRVVEEPVLLPNRKYTLRVSSEVRDAAGQQLGRAFTKSFRTVTEDRERPLPEKWTLKSPAVGGRQPLVVEFPEPIDRALLDRFLTLQDENGQVVEGRIEVGKEERSWAFRPTKDWQDIDYALKVDKDLEDLAGNTPVRLFDVDLSEAAPLPPRLTLRFRPRS